ncbi:helix-turn-helix domain-containing protein [Weissella koreensis]|uniref:helix-turn-helix domain-containing protein n=1 Tax=Weissella koreensis TaxID=165096 RepID=UPI0012B48685|nr:helix-turn-helix domain-containing protein [Weissella koreensis]QGN21011.1 HTH domain-containing protein [Weissella koreensis]
MPEEFIKHFAADIYSSDIRHQGYILTIIANHHHGLDISAIQEHLLLSRRTIYKYIESINEVAQIAEENETDENIHYGEIKKEKNLYYFTGNQINFHYLFCKIIDQSIAIILSKQFLVNHEISVKQFCYDNYISETALRRNIAKFNNYMKKYGVSILISKGSLTLNGDSVKIRFGLANFLWRNYRGLQWPFANISKKSMRNLALRIGTIYALDFNEGKLNELMYIFGTNLSQIHVNNFINPAEINQNLLDLLILDDRDQELYDYLNYNFELTDFELNFVILWFKTMSDAYSSSNRAQIIFGKLKALNHPFYKKIVKYIMAVESRTNTKIDFNTPNGELFLATVIAGQFHLNLFHDLNFTVSNIDMDQFGNNMEAGLFHGIRELTIPNNYELTEAELNTSIMFNAVAFILIFPSHYFDPKINILVKMDATSFAEQLFTTRINDILAPNFNVEIFTQKTMGYVIKPDVLVSTALFVDNKIDPEHQIFIKPQLDYNDRLYLREFMTRITKEKAPKIFDV